MKLSPFFWGQGLDELSEFERQHPEVDISSHVSKTSESFQKFIDVQLRKRSDRNAPKEESGTGASASAPSVASSANEQGLKAAREMPSVAEAYRQRTGNSRDVRGIVVLLICSTRIMAMSQWDSWCTGELVAHECSKHWRWVGAARSSSAKP